MRRTADVPGTVQSVQRAFAVLRAVAAGPAGISEISRRLDLPTSTVARMLTTLESMGAVTRRADGVTYTIGTAITDLVAATRGADLVSVSRVFLRDLVDRVSETAGISVLDGDEVHYVDHVESDNAVQVRNWNGVRLPPHVVSSGLVLLAHQPVDAERTLLALHRERFTDRTIVDLGPVRARLEQVRRDGFIWTVEEFQAGITSVAAPVFGRDGTIVAALHIHGPSYRFPAEHKALAENSLRAAAQRLSERLRHQAA